MRVCVCVCVFVCVCVLKRLLPVSKGMFQNKKTIYTALPKKSVIICGADLTIGLIIFDVACYEKFQEYRPYNVISYLLCLLVMMFSMHIPYIVYMYLCLHNPHTVCRSVTGVLVVMTWAYWT